MCRASSSSGPVQSMVGSLLFSLEDEECGMKHKVSHEKLQAQLSLLSSHLAAWLRPHGLQHSRLLRDVYFFSSAVQEEEGQLDAVVLASRLAGVGYRVAVRQAVGGGPGTECFTNLSNLFVVVAGEGDHEGVDFIVEPHFQDQFKISGATPRYAGLLALLPSVLVATAAQLAPLTQLLCSEMSLAFEQHGLSLPPWRQHKSVLSKWLPSKRRDLDMSPGCSPRAGSPEPNLLLPMLSTRASAELPALSPGALTPTWSGEEFGGGSPRAVLATASAVLISQQGAAGSGGGPAALRPKSLLSSSLAAVGGGNGKPHGAATPPQDTMRISASNGLSYRVSGEYQQPAIRTVRMTGGGGAGATTTPR